MGGLPRHIRDFLDERVGVVELVEPVKSAQQKVWIVSFRERDRVVVRVWTGGARWWNLNDKHDARSLARAETAAYRLARKALPDLNMPRILHVCHDDKTPPWALFSYVGINEENRIATSEWVDGMVKIRHEFGFDEPHPRWGRVPEDACLEYALVVLRTVTMTLHQHEMVNDTDLGPPRTYQGIKRLCRDAHDRMMRANHDQRALALLSDCIDTLPTNIPSLEPVLVHMDCQPQNLVFYRIKQQQQQQHNQLPLVASVLDWEEAAYADPRFELLLLGRKVCANRLQAQALWDTYQEETGTELGPLEPWLRLETVHSITTLLLQSMDLGGRSPWETKPDLYHKIQREFHRLGIHDY